MEEKEIFELQFIQFISSLYSSCMFQLGKMMNPVTGKVEKDLRGAQATIEMVRMLQAKTQGNLSPREKETLENALSNMQMNYVDEVDKEQKRPKEEKEKAGEKKKAPEAKAKKSKDKDKEPKDTKGKGRIITPGGNEGGGRIITP